jgi:ketosteroid isomerase-like protein
LAVHLNAIVTANLEQLEPTVADSVTLIFPDGQKMNSKADFMQLHESWFKETNWQWKPTFLKSHNSDSLGYALIQYQYSELDTTGIAKFTNDNYLVLIFKNSRKGWQLIHDQNTRIPH